MPLSSTTKFTFCGEEETLNLQMIMANPVSPPLNAMRSDLFLEFPNFFDLNNLSENSNNNNDTCENNHNELTKNDCDNENEFCQCKAHNLLECNDNKLVNIGFEFEANIHSEKCRKRKTSGTGRTDILEKRYCCEEDDNLLTISNSNNFKNESNLWPSESNKYCDNCGQQKLQNNVEAEESDNDDNQLTHSENLEESFVHQYQNNYHHLVKNFGYYQQSIRRGDQLVPMARQSHFVGPIVGLVAETPRILMF